MPWPVHVQHPDGTAVFLHYIYKIFSRFLYFQPRRLSWSQRKGKNARFPRDSYIYKVRGIWHVRFDAILTGLLRYPPVFKEDPYAVKYMERSFVLLHERPRKTRSDVFQGGKLTLLCMPDEAACANRLSFSDAEKIVSMLSDAVQDSLCRDDLCDFTGYRFRLRQIAVTVLKYSDGDIRLGILNRGAVDR